MTHAPGTYSPGTVDNGYGYAAATALTSARAVANADSYALYANGESGCYSIAICSPADLRQLSTSDVRLC